ncbi:MAG: hypothetical protein V4440_06135, partial [Pseudomonadota bacterium]
IIEKVNLRRKELITELNKLDSFVTTYQELTQSNQSFSPFTYVNNPKPRTQRSKRTLIESSVEGILKEKQPLSTETLLEKLSELGVAIGGATPLITLSTYLSRCEKFISRRKQGGWFLNTNEQTHQGANQNGFVGLQHY